MSNLSYPKSQNVAVGRIPQPLGVGGRREVRLADVPDRCDPLTPPLKEPYSRPGLAREPGEGVSGIGSDVGRSASASLSPPQPRTLAPFATPDNYLLPNVALLVIWGGSIFRWILIDARRRRYRRLWVP